MRDINRVTLVGRLGRDPERRNFPNGGSVLNLNVATSRKWKDKSSGDWKTATEWHRVAIFGDTQIDDLVNAEKGDAVFVEGELRTRKWTDKEGKDQYTTEINVNQFDGIAIHLSASSQKEKKPSGGSNDLDDEIPF